VSCATEAPAASCFRVLDREPLCERCADQAVAAQKGTKQPAGWVSRIIDPTICTRCNTDWGNVDLQRIGDLPFCAQCSVAVRDFPIPQWVKISLAATLVLVVVGTLHNLRYFRAIQQAHSANVLFSSGKLEEADVKMNAAAKLVPDAGGMSRISSFFHGLVLLRQEHSAEALKAIEQASPDLGQTPLYQQAHVSAMMGAAFERRDYDAFLEQSLELMKQDPNDVQGIAAAASAYACKFAETGEEKYRAMSLELLERSERDPNAKLMGDYAARTRYRLETREIISPIEYQRRFGAKGEAR